MDRPGGVVQADASEGMEHATVRFWLERWPNGLEVSRTPAQALPPYNREVVIIMQRGGKLASARFGSSTHEAITSNCASTVQLFHPSCNCLRTARTRSPHRPYG